MKYVTDEYLDGLVSRYVESANLAKEAVLMALILRLVTDIW